MINTWKTSSRSGNHGGQCVEIGGGPGTVAIRDSKNRAGGQLTPKKAAFTAFVNTVKQGRLDLS
ncbi:protein of unknown function (DUF397) [Streptoalloteichus tenebrarius]|uniref:DUF397 domain-containing protein n=1 Tax=Streptoalloteichus tenebrarius (strain ATCC 17920 / DSM 40477 / JCM 4838 / CBS 697.72 / NBRC 16177 / NCIMB 11028 / NRRL B-12390 / A12253. 1 / ISP 5477) TaxID=1933 RepID=A0ABT1HP18_STRSD|nr:DUF397 domain-containing protein [Streptoalloteichus tenebrarius]MCP2257250.1 protein of unknown function (DUF397) [Streptoalloteichus tenebrarius]BFF04157.1 hypothetical protein GCM10020241_58320 [Streptoalloteichus tenebrarius]